MERMPADERKAGPRRGDGLRRAVLTALASCLIAAQAPASWAAPETSSDLANLSLEELANLQVTSVSKKAEPLADAAASVYVITHDDIQRSGATSLPEALRLAPNLEVAQVDANSWAISARGNNATSADKLLVLIDGRIVYTPLFSGVFWDVQNVMLQDIDRIEVISGPGGTLWGTNAVNGVINVITRKSQDTRGLLADAGGGRYGADAEARYGGDSTAGSYRVYGKMLDRYATSTALNTDLHDGWNLAQAGARSDWDVESGRFTLQGDAYRGNEDQLLLPRRAYLAGFNLLTHWDSGLRGGSDLSLLAYYDQTKRYEPGNFGETLDVTDVELLQALPEFRSQSLIWGVSYRYAQDHVQNEPTSTLGFYPAEVNQAWASLFAQDEAELTESLRLIAGARAEHNPYTGTDLLPNVRLAWKPDEGSLLWGAVSRAVRSPSRLDVDLYAPSQPPFIVAGSPGFRSETVKVYEIGYRTAPAQDWSLSVTGYHNIYSHLRTENLASAAPLIVVFSNDMTESQTGLELWTSYQPTPDWRLSASFTTQRQGRTLSSSALPSSTSAEGNDPSSQWSLRSSYAFPGGQELDINLRRVASLPNPAVPAYTGVDLHFAWSMTKHFDWSVVAQNLFGPPHAEFGAPAASTQFGRGLYVKLEWLP